ncbi:MAG: RNA polymerase sigma factor [Pseudomonadota bacterium]
MSRLHQWLGATASGLAVASRVPGDDWALLRQACTGHQPSAEKLVKALTPQAYGLAIRMVGRREDAEDAVQDAFIRLWRSAPDSTRGAKLSTYFNTIVLNRCRSLLSHQREQGVGHDALTGLQDAQQVPDEPHALAALSPHASQSRLLQALDRLPARQRMALAMWAYADASVSDIAHTLAIDANAAHQLLHRAKLAMRASLQGNTL